MYSVHSRERIRRHSVADGTTSMPAKFGNLNVAKCMRVCHLKTYPPSTIVSTTGWLRRGRWHYSRFHFNLRFNDHIRTRSLRRLLRYSGQCSIRLMSLWWFWCSPACARFRHRGGQRTGFWSRRVYRCWVRISRLDVTTRPTYWEQYRKKYQTVEYSN